VAFGGRGNLWGAVFGSLLVNYFSATLTSDAPHLWPFMLGAMFLIAVLLPEGLSGLWSDLEKRIASGRSVVGPVLAVSGLILFIVPQALGLTPAFFDDTIAGMPIKYGLVTGGLCAYAVSRSLRLTRARPQTAPGGLSQPVSVSESRDAR
jgi:hypothetical protein